jgi:phosphate/phosphite/phosphonate ABC transporter binding protein
VLTLGWVSAPAARTAQRKMGEFARCLGRLAKVELTPRTFETYDDLTQAMFRGEIDLEWLPPIPFLALADRRSIAVLASVRKSPYRSAILVAAGSSVRRPASLAGARAAWVDRHSASGFVIPRIKLARAGLDPATSFAAEKFHGSHEAVVQAVVSGEADFGATWAQATPPRNVTGPWSRTTFEAGVRVLSVSGSIPPDVLAARADLAPTVRKAIVASLKTIYDEKQARWLVRDVFGTEAFYRPDLEVYAALKDTVAEAYEAGWLEVREPTLERPHLPQVTIPDAQEVLDVDDADVIDADVVESTVQEWALDEMDLEEIDVSFEGDP